MSDPLAWLLVIELMGLLGFPLAFFLFPNLPDRGYSLAKVLALLLAAYALWVLGLTGIVPNSPPTIAIILLAGAIAFGWLYYRRWPELEDYLRSQWRYVLVVEGLFLAMFLAWALVVSEAPAINHTEKPMDFAFLTSILQSPSFPPEDPWLAGLSISYYYFGHFVMALPLKLSGIPSNIGYNLALATLPALVAVASFGVAYNLIRVAGGGFRAGILFGMAAPLLITVTGNLEGALEFIQVRGWGSENFWQWVGIKGLDGASGSGLFPDGNWWWWRATRVIDTLEGSASLDYTITEFPFFSFLLGDLHSHVLSLPFALLALGLGLNLFLERKPVGPGRLLRYPWESAALALSFGALAFVNSWDFPVYAAILGGIVLTKAWRDARVTSDAESASSIEAGRRCLGRAFLTATSYLVPLMAVAVLLFLPFYITLSTQVSGILPHLGPGTRPLHFVLVMGLPALLGLAFLWSQRYERSRLLPVEAPTIVLVVVVSATPLLLWLLLAATWGVVSQGTESLPTSLASRTVTVLPALVVAGLAGFCAFSRAGQDRQPFLAFPLLLLAAAAFLLAGAELYHLADFFGNRMNTVFKVYYQAWLLLGIVGAFGIYYSCSRFASLGVSGKSIQVAWMAAAGALLVAALYYPAGAILDRTGWFSEGHDFKNNTLDGLAYIPEQRRAEYSAIRWLRDEAGPGRIVEAVGDDYSEYGRISAATGRPALLGWKGHEHQWRGTTEPFEGREEHIAQIYQGEDPLGRLPLAGLL